MPDNSSGIVIVPFVSMNSLAWSNMPASLTEFAGTSRYRQKLSLKSFRSSKIFARLTANQVVVGVAAAKLRPQYSLNGTNWFYLDDGNGTIGQLTGLNGNTFRVGEWIPLADAAKDDIFLRVVGLDGDGVADPAFANLQLEFSVGS